VSGPVQEPWDFSHSDDPAKNTVPNLPTPEGAALGKELARLVAPGFAKGRERFPGQLPPCDECAFVEGTVPNRSLATVMDALKCALECVPFYCHKGVTDDNPKRLCAGWVAANDA
jgi:hypothetical protein